MWTMVFLLVIPLDNRNISIFIDFFGFFLIIHKIIIVLFSFDVIWYLILDWRHLIKALIVIIVKDKVRRVFLLLRRIYSWFSVAGFSMPSKEISSIIGISTIFALIRSKMMGYNKIIYLCFICLLWWSFLFPSVLNLIWQVTHS